MLGKLNKETRERKNKEKNLNLNFYLKSQAKKSVLK